MNRRTFLRTGARTVVGAAAIAAGSGWLEGVRDTAAAAPAVKAAVQFGWVKTVEFAGSFIADDRGYYTSEGLDIDMLSGGPGVDVVTAIVSGKATFGCGTGAQILAKARQQGAPIKVLGVLYQKSPLAVLSLKKSPIRTPQELLGKRVGVAAADSIPWTTWLALNHLDASKITRVPVQFDPAPLVTGQVDAFLSFATEQPVELQVAGVPVEFFLLADYGYASYSGCYYVLEDTLKNRRDDVVRFMRAEVRGWEANAANPSLGAKLTVEKYGKALGLSYMSQYLGNKVTVEKLMQTPVTKQHGLLWMGDAEIAANVSLFKQTGITVGPELFTSEVLQEIYRGRNRV
ncbi:MAG TPA: ABC transporter substrate-binding protein [bacterium]|nr:ABC transporter substrate-binding protein [bacterium]